MTALQGAVALGVAAVLAASPVKVQVEVVQASNGNMRRALQRLESGAFKADAVQELSKELAMIASTKGEYAAHRRAELTAAIEAAKR